LVNLIKLLWLILQVSTSIKNHFTRSRDS